MKRGKLKISEAEMELLQLLWAESPLGAAEIAERAPAERGWQLATVKTLLARLVAKGAVKSEPEGRRYLYSPAVDRDSMAGPMVSKVVDRLFGGRVSPLVAQLAEERELSREDIDELEALVRSLKK